LKRAIGKLLFDVGGASATQQACNLDRRRRNARTLSRGGNPAYPTLITIVGGE